MPLKITADRGRWSSDGGAQRWLPFSNPQADSLLENQRKSGTLTFDFEGALGKIHIKAGMMINAEYGRLTGELAVAKMLQRTKGSFHLDPREMKTEVTIHRPTTTVLMDVARTMDERGNG